MAFPTQRPAARRQGTKGHAHGHRLTSDAQEEEFSMPVGGVTVSIRDDPRVPLGVVADDLAEPGHALILPAGLV